MAQHLTVADLVRTLDDFAPTWLAEEWDNVGLLLGSPADALTGPVLITIDLTEAVLEEAFTHKAAAVIAYHPPIFKPIKRLVDDSALSRTLLRAARAGLAIYSPHTALDATRDGMTDWLANKLLLSRQSGSPHSADRRALRPAPSLPPSQRLKIVTFVPADALERVRLGLASAGAGMIGEYSVCSFAAEGTGTFFGSDKASPAVGNPGQLESVREMRLEMVCARRALPIALQTLKQFHPYEHPAIDVYELQPQPRRDTGLGRRLILDTPQDLETIAQRLKTNLNIPVVTVAQAKPGKINTIGVCPGAGGDLAPLALSDGCELFITGEMKHHEVLAMTAAGLSILLCGHTATERGYLPTFAQQLSTRLPSAKFIVSTADADPLRAV
ncbi:MAG: Nif3-like dinuclear metal center hexameric protein [Phycisphaerales bacterium]|nr:Nif3-like dinuclear metal center hexameric protein [Phycisphaerales bacterium]